MLDFLVKLVKGLSGCEKWSFCYYLGNVIVTIIGFVGYYMVMLNLVNNLLVCIRFIYCFFIFRDRRDLLETFFFCVGFRNVYVF